MNDDFLYTRQEEPSPEFVAELRESLAAMDIPEKAKRKNGQRRFPLRAIAAIFVLVIAGGVAFINIPELQIPISNLIFGLPNEDVLLEAQETMGFPMPTMPNAYYLLYARQTDAYFPHIFIMWKTYRGNCYIKLSVLLNPLSPEALAWEEEYMSYLAERSDWLDLVPLDATTNAIWRISSVANQPNTVELEWRTADIAYSLDAIEDCASLEDLSAIAQSMLP